MTITATVGANGVAVVVAASVIAAAASASAAAAASAAVAAVAAAAADVSVGALAERVGRPACDGWWKKKKVQEEVAGRSKTKHSKKKSVGQ